MATIILNDGMVIKILFFFQRKSPFKAFKKLANINPVNETTNLKELKSDHG